MAQSELTTREGFVRWNPCWRGRLLPIAALAGWTVSIFWVLAGLLTPLAGQSRGARSIQRDEASAISAHIDSSCAWVGEVSVLRYNQLVAGLGDANSPNHALRVVCTQMRLMLAGRFTNGASGISLGASWAQSVDTLARRILARAPTNDTMLTVYAGLALLAGVNQRFGAAESPTEVVDRSLVQVPGGIALPELTAAIRGGHGSQFTRRSCVSLAINVGDFITARDCVIRGLESGGDSTWLQLRLAAMAMWREDTTEGLAAFRAAVLSSQASSQAREDLVWHLEAAPVKPTDCGACLPNGILTIGQPVPASGATWHHRRLSADLRDSLRKFAPPELLTWIERAMADSGAAEVQVAPYLGPGGLAIHRWGSVLARRLFAHFYQTAYRRGTFRGCLSWTDFPHPPCTPRTLPLPDTYITTQLAATNIWDPATALPTTLLTWALSSGELGREPDDPARVTVEWRRSGVEEGVTWDSTVALAVPPRPREESWLMAVTPIPSDRAPTVSMILTQGSARRGGVFIDHIVPLDTAAIAISDPILGQAGTGVTWLLGADTVPMSPFRMFARKSAVALTYQVRSDREVLDARTRVRILGPDAETWQYTHELITVAFPVAVPPGISAHSNEIRMPDLESGEYRFEIAVVDGNRMLTTSRSVAFRVR